MSSVDSDGSDGSDGDYSDGESSGGAHGMSHLLHSTIQGLTTAVDPSAQIAFLTSFCEALALTEYDEDLYSLPLEEIVPVIVNLMGGGGIPDVMLLSARVLTYFLDRIPKSAKVLVRHGVIEALSGPLMVIEYFDVAEQCLDALKMLSKSQSVPCLKAGMINTVLSYIDFFPSSAQNAAVSIVANVCQQIPEDCVSKVMDAIPTLCNLLDYQDRKLVESAATCLMMIVEHFNHSSELLDDLCKHGMVKQSLALISPNNPMTLSETTYIGMIGLLVQLASRSLLAVRTLYELDINNILGSIFRTPELSCNTPHLNIKNISRDQMHIALKLIGQLIPSVSYDGQDTQLVLSKEKIIMEEDNLSLQFATNILPALMQTVDYGTNTCISYGCVSVVRNYVSLVNPEMLRELISNSNIPKFLAGLLSRKDHHILIPSLNIVEIIMNKFPNEFLNSFIKEGVGHAIWQLSKLEDCPRSHLMDGQSNEDQTSINLSRCLCYAFDPCSPPSSGSKICRVQRRTLPLLAQSIMSTFFTEYLISDMVLSENLQKLKACCAMLDDNVDGTLTKYAEKEELLCQLLNEVVIVLSKGKSVSTFEFIESGFMKSLVHYLTNGNLHKGQDSGKNPDIYNVLLNGVQSFASVLFSGQRWQNFPLTSLVEHSQNALSSLECFPVVMGSAHVPTTGRTDIPNQKSTTKPCFQVKFVRTAKEKGLRHYDRVVTVEFSSSFDNIEGFLWPKVIKKEKKKAAILKVTCPSKQCKEQSSQIVDSTEQIESSASQSKKGDIGPKLVFFLNGKQLDQSVTLYQAILQDKINADPDIVVDTEFWNEVYRVKFKRAKKPLLSPPQVPFDTFQSLFSSMLLSELPCKLERSNPCYDILFVLKIFEGLNRSSFQLCSHERCNAFAEGKLEDFDDLKVTAPSFPQTEFVSTKLTAKLEQQMQDQLALSTGTMPLWCTQLVIAYPFLFSFEARLKYFRLNVIGRPRTKEQDSGKNDTSTTNSSRSRPVKLPRKKFKVHRNCILSSAAKMMNWYASKKVPLEIEFNNEVGTGLGPTLEFYTLVGHELQKVGMGMWRGDKISKIHSRRRINISESDLIIAPSGLFPRPWASDTDFSNGISFSKVLKNFFLLGQLMARAIRDRRTLDLPFSRAFYKLILEQDMDIYDIPSFEPQLGRTLIEFQGLVKRKKTFESSSGQFSNGTVDLSFRNSAIEDLCLDFALPGYPDYVFSPKCEEKMVNTNNLEEYISLVIDATLRSGISRQLESFKSGFNQVFPIKALQIFTTEELERVLRGEQEPWNWGELQDHINFDHGYSSTSPPAQKFLEIIHEFDAHQRRAFLHFVTGSPLLPTGGLAGLEHKLTVVCKPFEDDSHMQLPSVMTCVNYLKLPPYSSKEQMREKLLYAIMEGQRTFHLS